MGNGSWLDIRDGNGGRRAPADRPDGAPAPPRVTAAQITANRAKQDAYAARRRAWTDHWHKPGDETEAPSPAPDQPARPARGRGGVIHDKRQGRFEL